MTYLVAGADRVDAGKTTFAVGLVHALGTTGFKPRAGNDYWFHHDDYQHAIADGRMYGKDARRLADASETAVTPEAINPIHRLWRPAPAGDRFIGPSDRMFVLDRVRDDYVVNATADLPPSARDALPLAGAPTVGSVEELNRVMRDRHLPALAVLEQDIAETSGAVVESYGDVARPVSGITVDQVAVVQPSRVRIYDGGRYWDACEVASGSPRHGQLEERVGDVTDVLDPIDTVALPALSDADRERPARIARAYEAAYDRVR